MGECDGGSGLSGDVAGMSEFFNRDLSWLEFNRRVLAQATDARTPLLERVKFLAIFSSNLDEFFMKRVGLLRRLAREGVVAAGPDGMSVTQTLAEIRRVSTELQDEQARCWEGDVRPALAEHGVEITGYAELKKKQRRALDEWHAANVFPVLTPLGVDPGHRFPFLSNLSENLGVLVSAPGSVERHFVRVKIPDVLPRLVPLPDAAEPGPPWRFVPLDEVITANLAGLFPGMELVDVAPFRVTRSAAVDRDDIEVEDLLERVQAEIHMRRFADAVRIEAPPDASPPIIDLVCEELKLSPDDVYRRGGLAEYADLYEIAGLPLPELKYKPWAPAVPLSLGDEEIDIFSIIRERDVLVHHPYESFNASVERFIAAAARDPDVLAIKQTIYRTSRDSPFVASMIRGADAGKSVACLVELRARFDEHRNVRFARLLEEHGVHVAYGVPGLKTHCKCSLVVRREGSEIRTYAHIGTGNYHPSTAQLYTDVGVLTADPEITSDVVHLFNELTGRSHEPDYKRLIVAPRSMRSRFSELIEREITNATAGRPARIMAKINSLEDRKITEQLYEASRAGVEVTLIVRGFCCLRPGVPGLSENIRVISVVGRFLEHSRIFHFADGRGDPTEGVWIIGSGDWMHRNLNNRVEACLPVEDTEARRRLWRIVRTHLDDHRCAWDLHADGTYTLRTPTPDDDPDSPEVLGTFETLMRAAAG